MVLKILLFIGGLILLSLSMHLFINLACLQTEDVIILQNTQPFVININNQKTNHQLIDISNEIIINFTRLSEWIRDHPNGQQFAMDSSEIDYDSTTVHEEVMNSWNDRDLVQNLDIIQLEEIENQCIRKWKALIQKEIDDEYVGEYLLKQGNKIGALRHFGLIPWDDDFDVLIYIKHTKYQDIILNLFDEIPVHPEYGKCSMVYRKCGFAKIYFNDLNKTLDVEGFGNMDPNAWNTEYSHLSTNEIRYPLIDIFFGYLDDEDVTKVLTTHCGDIVDSVPKCQTTKFDETFPAQYLPINDKYYPFERNVLFTMSQHIGEYGEDDPIKICVIEIMGLYSHRKDTEWAYSDPIQCKVFWNDFTFVRIDEIIDQYNIYNISWIKLNNNKNWIENLKFINIKISFDKNNVFHRAYMMPMFNDNTFQTLNITTDILHNL